MSCEFDPGPPPRFAEHFAAMPPYAPFGDAFWHDWGPVFYRGRLDGSARLLCIASDPGATERIAGRTLVGDAGQRVQGFLTKLGLTRSYICLNAYAVGLIPSRAEDGTKILDAPDHRAWRNTLYDMAKSPEIQAIVGFGSHARRALERWPGRDALPVFDLPHPSSRDPDVLAHAWREAIVRLRRIVNPDPDGDTTLPNYAARMTEADYRAVPARDLPFGLPAFVGDDSWLRAQDPPKYASVGRPRPDDRHTLIWTAPRKG